MLKFVLTFRYNFWSLNWSCLKVVKYFLSPGSSIFSGLVKRWFQDIKNDVEEPIQAILRFKNGIIGTTNQIFCYLSSPCSDIIDGLKHCQVHNYKFQSLISMNEYTKCQVRKFRLNSYPLNLVVFIPIWYLFFANMNPYTFFNVWVLELLKKIHYHFLDKQISDGYIT